MYMALKPETQWVKSGNQEYEGTAVSSDDLGLNQRPKAPPAAPSRPHLPLLSPSFFKIALYFKAAALSPLTS